MYAHGFCFSEACTLPRLKQEATSIPATGARRLAVLPSRSSRWRLRRRPESGRTAVAAGLVVLAYGYLSGSTRLGPGEQ